MGDALGAVRRRCWNKYLRLADMENMRQTPTRPSMASRLLSTLESAGLAATATFASVVWIGLALPGLPLLPGVGGGQNSNVAISLSSAVLGVQDSQTFGSSSGVAGRQARLLSLLLPAPDTLSRELATKQPNATTSSGASMVVALPAPPPPEAAPRDVGPRVMESVQSAATASRPAPSPHAPPPPPRPPVSSPPPRVPEPEPQTPAPPTFPIDPPPPEAGETTPTDEGSPDATTPPDPGTAPADGNGTNGNGNGNSNGNAGGNNPNAGGANAGGNGNGNAGGNNPNAGGANAGGNGNGNGNGAPKGTPKKGP